MTRLTEERFVGDTGDSEEQKLHVKIFVGLKYDLIKIIHIEARDHKMFLRSCLNWS